MTTRLVTSIALLSAPLDLNHDRFLTVRSMTGDASQRFGLQIALALPHLIEVSGEAVLEVTRLVVLVVQPGLRKILARNKVPDLTSGRINNDVAVQVTLATNRLESSAIQLAGMDDLGIFLIGWGFQLNRYLLPIQLHVSFSGSMTSLASDRQFMDRQVIRVFVALR